MHTYTWREWVYGAQQRTKEQANKRNQYHCTPLKCTKCCEYKSQPFGIDTKGIACVDVYNVAWHTQSRCILVVVMHAFPIKRDHVMVQIVSVLVSHSRPNGWMHLYWNIEWVPLFSFLTFLVLKCYAQLTWHRQ